MLRSYLLGRVLIRLWAGYSLLVDGSAPYDLIREKAHEVKIMTQQLGTLGSYMIFSCPLNGSEVAKLCTVPLNRTTTAGKVSVQSAGCRRNSATRAHRGHWKRYDALVGDSNAVTTERGIGAAKPSSTMQTKRVGDGDKSYKDEPLLRRPLRLSNKKTGVEKQSPTCKNRMSNKQTCQLSMAWTSQLVVVVVLRRHRVGSSRRPKGQTLWFEDPVEDVVTSAKSLEAYYLPYTFLWTVLGHPELQLVMSGLHTTLRILRDAPTNTSPSSPILQVASANRLIVGAALASSRRSIKFFVDESCSSLTFFRLSTQEAPPEIPKSSLWELLPLFQLLEPTTTTTCLHTRASLRDRTFLELSSLDPEMQPSATSPYVVVYFGQNPGLFGKEATLSPTARSKISLPTPTTTYNFNDYLAVLSTKSVFEMAHYKSTAQNPFGGLQAFLNGYRVLFSPSTLKTYFRDDLISLATRVKDIFGLVDAWTANINNELPLAVDRARLTVFCNLRDAYQPSIFEEDAELRSWVSEEEEKALNQGLAQLVSLAECKFGRPEMPFAMKTTNEDGEEESVVPDHSSINFGPPEKGEKFYLSPPIANSRRNPFTGGAGTSTSKTPPLPPKPTRKSAFAGLETKTGASTPLSATKVATATRSAPGITTSTRTSETTQKQPTKPAKTATKPATASKAPAKLNGGASKSSTPAPGHPLPRATRATKDSTTTSTTNSNRRKRTQDDLHYSSVEISSEPESTPASNLRATKERAARSRTLPAIAVLEGSPEPPPAKKQRLSKTDPAPNAQASSSTSVVRTKTKRKAMAGEDDRGRWHRHYNDFPHVNKLPEVNPQPNYPQAQSLILAKRTGIFANVDTDPAPELRVVEAMAAYTDRVVNGPYPWKCDQCNTSRKVCVFCGHDKKCDACASARNSCSILSKGLKFFFHQEDAAGRVALAPSHMASEAQRARRLRKQADLLIDQAARLHYEADIMTAHNTVAVLQILKMSPDDKKLVDEYRKTDDDICDIFDNVDTYRKTFDIVVNQFPDLRDPRFSLPSDSQMKSPKKKKPAKPKPKATKKGKEKAVEPVEEEEEDFEEEEGQEEEPEMEDEVEGTQELERSASPAATEHIPSEDEGDNGEDTDNTYYPPKSQSEEEEIPPTDDEEDADGDRDSQQEEEDEDKVFDQLHSSPLCPSILGFEEESVEREDAIDEGTMQAVVDVILGRNTEEEGETAEPCIDA
ncbi:hypothetical protein K435DRAFT_802518 [Dendrothele bispora CBS 962.96]|uniref:Zn(2)-C6 fungal-type domain-containing protein n=1 Tax=Dendrothele bispora (strain CBS 962.96) TaxID=1314807 RepID=A0A4S8LKP2_DENBC|nr:hypothetical protein K435DRAFT_802518 [Dendrothele bispora CBS 962.96]